MEKKRIQNQTCGLHHDEGTMITPLQLGNRLSCPMDNGSFGNIPLTVREANWPVLCTSDSVQGIDYIATQILGYLGQKLKI